MSLFDRLFGKQIKRRVNLAVRALDDVRDRRYNETNRDRYTYDREQVLLDALEAWRLNPLARRIVELTSQYVVGSGLGVDSEDKTAHAFLQKWWSHRLNHLSIRSFEWCDELTRSGELFIALSTDDAGMSYVRAIPALEIENIQAQSNDIEQEISFQQKPPTVGEEAIIWRAYDPLGDDGQSPVMLHYAVNRPVGAQRGESDLAPILRWLTRYSAWLEDRARLNRFRQTFLFWVRARFENDAERQARETALNANPPNPGSVLVTHETEQWSVLEPKLEAHQAAEDGLALKKMIASGAGIPIHFLAEPESATRTTAESAGGPTFRHYDQRQQFFLWLLSDLAVVALKRRSLVDRAINPDVPIAVHGTDVSTRDNATLSASASSIVHAFSELYANNLITGEEFIRMVYKFAGEVVDVQKLIDEARAAKQGDTWKSNTPTNQPSNPNNPTGTVPSPTGTVPSANPSLSSGAPG